MLYIVSYVMLLLPGLVWLSSMMMNDFFSFSPVFFISFRFNLVVHDDNYDDTGDEQRANIQQQQSS